MEPLGGSESHIFILLFGSSPKFAYVHSTNRRRGRWNADENMCEITNATSVGK